MLSLKLYQYEEIRKLNQALGSFKRNKVPIIEVQTLAIGGKVHHFVLTDPKYEPRPEKEPRKKIKKKEVKKKVEKKEVKLPKPNEGEKVTKGG